MGSRSVPRDAASGGTSCGPAAPEQVSLLIRLGHGPTHALAAGRQGSRAAGLAHLLLLLQLQLLLQLLLQVVASDAHRLGCARA
jgi:hypothetical protein